MIAIIVKLKNRITKKLQMRGKHMHSFVLNWKKKKGKTSLPRFVVFFNFKASNYYSFNDK